MKKLRGRLLIMFDLIKGQQKFLGDMYGQVFDLYKGLVDPEDFSKDLDFFEQVSEKYEDTVGKTLKMMNMGINLETLDEQQKALDSYYQFIISAEKLFSIVSKANQECLKSLTEKYQNMAKEGQKISTFDEFYNLWYVTNEKAMEELFATATFSKAFAEFSDKYFKYLSASNTVLERNLSNLPIPTSKDMNSLYLTVYTLRKDVRDLKKENETLKKMFSTRNKSSKAE